MTFIHYLFNLILIKMEEKRKTLGKLKLNQLSANELDKRV